MPVSTTYPGVYIQEVPSGVRTIAGASTSVAAFVGFTKLGLTSRAVRITSYPDFERQFGGLDRRSELSYAVQQFYLNGGTEAWVVRATAADAAVAERVLLSVGPPPGSGSGSGPSGVGPSGSGDLPANAVLTVKAISPGKWGNQLQVGVDYKGTRRAVDADGTPLEDQPVEFNLVVREMIQSGAQLTVQRSETYRNLNFDPASARYVEQAINAESSLIEVEDHNLGDLPTPTGPDVINQPDAEGTQWLWLGRDGFAAGSDGTEPGASSGDWERTAGAAALLGETPWNKGIYELERIAPLIFNLLILAGTIHFESPARRRVLAAAATFCEDKRAFGIIDLPSSVDTPTEALAWLNGDEAPRTNHAAVYFPLLNIPDPLNENRTRLVGPSGTMAGIYARTDSTRGIWKAPAGTDADLRGVSLPLKLTDLENGGLNPFGINVLRNFPIFGNVCWGARTLEGADQQASEWKYIPIRRTALYIEESLYQGLKWVVFEPNDEPLWAQIRLNVGAFMHSLFRQGAFQGASPREAYFVRCDKDTTTQNDIDRGIVNIVVGFAPLKPAEFVVIQIQQIAGQIEA